MKIIKNNQRIQISKCFDQEGRLQADSTAVSRAGGYMRELELSLSQMCAMADSWKTHIKDVFGVFVLAW